VRPFGLDTAVGLEAHRWATTELASVIEEAALMGRDGEPRRTLLVRRSFEPGRLSPEWLASAYDQVLPQSKCIVLPNEGVTELGAHGPSTSPPMRGRVA
jgi:hypothetical protein